MDSRLFDGIAEFENKLRATGYRQLEPFFVLREGEIYDERNGGTVKLDRQRLQEIAEVQNRRIAHTGDATPIILGHTVRGKEEHKQPKIQGWATRFEVHPFLNTNTYGLRAVPWSREENIKNFDAYPRRSAELWTNPDLIDPISLLGPNTPRLDLGLHRLQRGQDDAADVLHPRRPLILEMTMPDEPTDAPATPANKDAAAGAGDVTAQVQALQTQLDGLMQLLKPLLDEIQASGAGAGGPGDGMGGPPGAPPGGGMGGPPPMPAGPGGPGGPPEPPAQMNMSGGTPAGGMNTMMPTQMSRTGGYFYDPNTGSYFQQVTPPPQAAYQPPQQQQAPVQLQHSNGGNGSYDARDRELAVMRQQLGAMQLQMVSTDVNRILDELDRKVVIDRKRDFDNLVQLSRVSAAKVAEEVTFMLATRAKKEEPLPGEAVPLQFQANPGGDPRQTGAGPVQLSLEQAINAAHQGVGPDPKAGRNGPAVTSMYDQITDLVRNRTRGGDPMEAYRRVMGGSVDPTSGKTITPTRG